MNGRDFNLGCSDGRKSGGAIITVYFYYSAVEHRNINVSSGQKFT